MIAYLKGRVLSKTAQSAVLETGGVGYEVFFCGASLEALAQAAQTEVFIAESISMYGGTALYGFLSAEEKALFELFRDAVPSTGAKKALEYLNKALRSLPDFKKAVIKNDIKLLITIFGFTAKTAEKISAALKDKIQGLSISGTEKIKGGTYSADGAYMQVLSALSTLGFRPGEARDALEEAAASAPEETENIEAILKRALKLLSPK
ncbi:MAG TPA: hypothetical protein DCL44_06485 [Elusimicrobia bacterium]|nr:hypothetical protein [Elusimicrobiota bacterium]